MTLHSFLVLRFFSKKITLYSVCISFVEIKQLLHLLIEIFKVRFK